MNKIIFLSMVCCLGNHAMALTPLNEEELSNFTGQAAFYTAYTPPTGSGTGAVPADYGFFTLGLNGTVAINANIQHLQLGCGGVNGAGNCDIDINNLSLSGQGSSVDSAGNQVFTTPRSATDAVITNPFLQLAIKNPTALATRQVVGINFGAEKILGLLTAGTENPNTLNEAVTVPRGVGINTLSGYLSIASASGIATTKPRTLTETDTGLQITGNVSTTTLGNCSIINPCLPLTTTSYNFNVGSASVPFTTSPVVVNGTRLNSVNLTGSGIVNGLGLSGGMSATATLLFVPIPVTLTNVTGSISNLTANLSVSEGLSYIHSIPLNNPLSLSLQSTQVLWPGSVPENVAQPGWWMGVGGTVNIGNITPSSSVAVTNQVLAQAIPYISQYLAQHPVNCGLLATSCLINAPLNLGTINLPTGSNVNFPLSNLVLGAQNPIPNCYGNLRFC